MNEMQDDGEASNLILATSERMNDKSQEIKKVIETAAKFAKQVEQVHDIKSLNIDLVLKEQYSFGDDDHQEDDKVSIEQDEPMLLTQSKMMDAGIQTAFPQD